MVVVARSSMILSQGSCGPRVNVEAKRYRNREDEKCFRHRQEQETKERREWHLNKHLAHGQVGVGAGRKGIQLCESQLIPFLFA